MAAGTNSPTLLSRFQGALVGAIFGDCLGGKFELFWAETPIKWVTSHMKDIKEKVKSQKEEKGFILYTDDSCMTFDLAESLAKNKGYNVRDVATRFCETYFASTAQRNYGGNVVFVFKTLKEKNYEGDESDFYEPAKKQFTGTGSYGNGSAMRVSPVALFHHDDIPNMVTLASNQSRLTHTNPKGINGAILQALAIEKAMKSDKITDTVKFCQELIQQLEEVTTTDKEDVQIYKDKMDLVVKLLTTETAVTAADINMSVGSGVTAQKAVPAAIFSFLYTLKKKRIPKLSKYNGLVRAVAFAVAFAEDSDTVGSMAGAIAGAYYGIEEIPKEWMFACEGADRALKLANDIHALNQESHSTL